MRENTRLKKKSNYVTKRANSSLKSTFFLEIAILFLSNIMLHKSTFLKRNLSAFALFEFFFHRLAYRKKLILSQEKYFKSLKDMVIGL